MRDKWALVVGIGDFKHEDVPKLQYAAKDARDFRNFLVGEANFAPDHVRLLLDEKATQRRILSELGNKFLARVARPEDLVVLFFSTHGSPAQADIRGDNFLVAYDTDPDDLFTTGIEMDKILEAIKDRILSQRVLLVMDACHSGAASKGTKGLKRVGNFDAEMLMQGSGQLVICSSTPEQQSWESKRYPNGIFTRKLIDSLRQNGPATKLGEAFARVKSSVPTETQEDYGVQQNPVLKSKWNGNELLLAAAAAAPQGIPGAVRAILEPDSTAAPRTPEKSGAAADMKTAAPAPGDPLVRGINLYKKGDYGSAAASLEVAVKGKAASDANAHYYLASALMKVNRIDEAVQAYSQCYRLNPKGPTAAYCLRIMNQYSGVRRLPAGQVRMTGKPAAAGATRSELATDGAGASQNPYLKEDLAKFERIKSNMPRLKPHEPEEPTLADILQWNLNRQADYLHQAQARVQRATQVLEDARLLEKKARSMADSVLPRFRGHGEEEEPFRQRVEAARGRLEELVRPYTAEAERCQGLLKDEIQIYDSCLSAYRTVYQPRYYQRR